MKVVLSRVFELNEEQEKLVKETAKECALNNTNAVEELYFDGQLILEDFYEEYDKILYVE